MTRGFSRAFGYFTRYAAVKHTTFAPDPVAQGVYRYGRRCSRTRSPDPKHDIIYQNNAQASKHSISNHQGQGAGMKQAFYPGLGTGVTEEYSVALVEIRVCFD